MNKVVLFALAVLLMGGKPGNYKLINIKSYATGSARGFFYKKTVWTTSFEIVRPLLSAHNLITI